jgi:excisionase family DNA binding protein
MTRIRDLESHPDQFVTVRELADYLHVSKWQVHKWLDAGVLSARRHPGMRTLRIPTSSARKLESRPASQ